MSDTSLIQYDDRPAPSSDAAAPIKLALVTSAVLALCLVVWNVLAALH